MKIVIVDDSPIMRTLIRSALSEGGEIDVHEAEDGRKGCQLVDELAAAGTPPDIVLTDLNMPVMDGFGLTETLRGGRLGKVMPILMLTTEAGAEKRARGMASGVTGWLTKPCEPRHLLSAIRSVTL